MYIEGELSIVKPGEFEDAEGKVIAWFENYIKTHNAEGDVEVFVFNSKENFSEAEGKSGVFKLRPYKARAWDQTGKEVKGLVKISIVGFKEN